MVPVKGNTEYAVRWDPGLLTFCLETSICTPRGARSWGRLSTIHPVPWANVECAGGGSEREKLGNGSVLFFDGWCPLCVG